MRANRFVGASLAATLIFSGCQEDQSASPEKLVAAEEAESSTYIEQIPETTVVDSRTQTEFMLDSSYSRDGQAQASLERGMGFVAVNELTGTERGELDGGAVRVYFDYDGTVDISTFAGGPNGLEVPGSIIELNSADLASSAEEVSVLEPLNNDVAMGTVQLDQLENGMVDVVVQWDVSDESFDRSLNGMFGR